MSGQHQAPGSSQPPNDSASIPDEYRGRCRDWYRGFKTWNEVYWGLGLFVSLGSVLVAAKVPLLNRWPTTFSLSQGIGLLVALAAAINTFLQPKQESERCRIAWIEMDTVIKEKEGVHPELIKVARKAEDWLSGGITKTHPDGTAAKPGH